MRSFASTPCITMLAGFFFRYDVLSSLDIRQRSAKTSLWFDANTGAMRLLWLPTGGASGIAARVWLTSLHMAAV